MLTAPLDALALLFREAFMARGFRTDLVNADWAKGTLTIEFPLKSPTSDEIRDSIFKLYQKQWGGKPEGMEVVYKRAIEPNPRRGDANCGIGLYSDAPIRLFVTSNMKFLSALARCEAQFWSALARYNEFVVLDSKEFKDWQASQVHNLHKRARPVSTAEGYVNKGYGPMLGRENVDPGEQVPVVRIGLFKL
jgi:hypothetical protein